MMGGLTRGLIRDLIRDSVRDLTRDPVRGPVRDPVRAVTVHHHHHHNQSRGLNQRVKPNTRVNVIINKSFDAGKGEALKVAESSTKSEEESKS